MKKILLLSVLSLGLVCKAQLNSRFYSNGNASRVAAVGAYGANTYLQWIQVQATPASTFNWSFTDQLVQSYQTASLNLMITLSCTHPYDAQYTTTGTCAYQFTNGVGDNKANWPVTGSDTTLWKQFVLALVDRYDMDGSNDMPGLSAPVKTWHIIGQEWSRVWCDGNLTDTAFQSAKDFVKLNNMTFNVIKTKQPASNVSFAGIDTRFQTEAFYDGYLPVSQTVICNNSNNCTTTSNLSKAQLAASPKFLPSRRNVVYILKNALADEIDVHHYGRYANTSDFVRWTKDSSLGKPVIFMEGGGPYCPSCENIYHSTTDTDGRLPANLVRDNASYVVYYFMNGLANDVRKLHWNLPNEYPQWGPVFGDLDLHTKNDKRKPSFFTYRFLAKNIFSHPDADTVVKITEANPALWHYQIKPLGMNVAWSTNAADSFVLTGNGQLYRWDIPVTCDALIPNWCDSIIQQTSFTVNGSYTMHVNNNVPAFYSWSNVLGISSQDFPEKIELRLFPNPASSRINLSCDKYLENAELVLTDVLGRKMKIWKDVSGQSYSLDCEEFPSGIYFLKLSQGGKSICVRKLLIED